MAHPRHHTPIEPQGCRWCGVPKPHGWSWSQSKGSHQWEQPTDAQVKARMLARRKERAQ